MGLEDRRARALERHRDRYYADPEFRERIKRQGRLSAQKMHDELLANPKDPRHGTITAYFKGLCKCRKCKDAMNEYNRDYKKKPPRPRRRHQWASDVAIRHAERISERDKRIRILCARGLSMREMSEAMGYHLTTARRHGRRLGLNRQFEHNYYAAEKRRKEAIRNA